MIVKIPQSTWWPALSGPCEPQASGSSWPWSQPGRPQWLPSGISQHGVYASSSPLPVKINCFYLWANQEIVLCSTSEYTLIKLGFYAEACRSNWRLAKGDGSKTSRTSTMISCCSVAVSVVWAMMPSLQYAVQQQHMTQTDTVHAIHPQPNQYVSDMQWNSKDQTKTCTQRCAIYLNDKITNLHWVCKWMWF